MLRREDSHYLRKVLRKRPGDEVALLDGQGTAWRCALTEDVMATRIGIFPAVTPLPLKLCVGLALCKGSRFEGALEKLAELGVTEVTPLLTERTERKAPSKAKEIRWQDIVLSASAVAGRLIPLELRPTQSLESFATNDLVDLCFCHPSGTPPTEFFTKVRDSLTLLIGPEGGFSEQETSQLKENGTQVDLGPLNLRVETAAAVACGLALNLSPKGM